MTPKTALAAEPDTVPGPLSIVHFKIRACSLSAPENGECLGTPPTSWGGGGRGGVGGPPCPRGAQQPPWSVTCIMALYHCELGVGLKLLFHCRVKGSVACGSSGWSVRSLHPLTQNYWQPCRAKTRSHCMGQPHNSFACCQNRRVSNRVAPAFGISACLASWGHVTGHCQAVNPWKHIPARPHCVLWWLSDDLEITLPFWTISQSFQGRLWDVLQMMWWSSQEERVERWLKDLKYCRVAEQWLWDRSKMSGVISRSSQGHRMIR